VRARAPRVVAAEALFRGAGACIVFVLAVAVAVAVMGLFDVLGY
jgi:hypothetical protein